MLTVTAWLIGDIPASSLSPLSHLDIQGSIHNLFVSVVGKIHNHFIISCYDNEVLLKVIEKACKLEPEASIKLQLASTFVISVKPKPSATCMAKRKKKEHLIYTVKFGHRSLML